MQRQTFIPQATCSAILVWSIGLYRFMACRLWSELFSTWKTVILSLTSVDKVTCVRPISQQTLRSEDLADRRLVTSEFLLVDCTWLTGKSLKRVCFEIACVLLKLKSLHSVLSNCKTGSVRWTGDMAVSFWFDTSKMRNFFSDLSVTER